MCNLSKSFSKPISHLQNGDNTSVQSLLEEQIIYMKMTYTTTMCYITLVILIPFPVSLILFAFGQIITPGLPFVIEPVLTIYLKLFY